jgi:hypothetical protein
MTTAAYCELISAGRLDGVDLLEHSGLVADDGRVFGTWTAFLVERCAI